MLFLTLQLKSGKAEARKNPHFTLPRWWISRENCHQNRVNLPLLSSPAVRSRDPLNFDNNLSQFWQVTEVSGSRSPVFYGLMKKLSIMIRGKCSFWKWNNCSVVIKIKLWGNWNLLQTKSEKGMCSRVRRNNSLHNDYENDVLFCDKHVKYLMDLLHKNMVSHAAVREMCACSGCVTQEQVESIADPGIEQVGEFNTIVVHVAERWHGISRHVILLTKQSFRN